MNTTTHYLEKARAYRPPTSTKDVLDCDKSDESDKRSCVAGPSEPEVRAAFDAIAGPRWSAAWRTQRRLPHPALEQAIDGAAWDAFLVALRDYEAVDDE